MATEYVLSFTGIEVEEKLKEIENLSNNSELFSNTAVFCTEQSLTDEQKAIARANIGAAEDGILDENGKLLNSALPDGYPMKTSVTEILLEYHTVDDGYAYNGWSIGLMAGESYTVVLDGVEYPDLIATYVEYQFGDYVEISYPSLFTIKDFIEESDHHVIIIPNHEVKHIITIMGQSSTVIHMSEEYIPDTIARTKDIPEGFSGSWNDLTDKPEIPEPVTDKHINDLIDTKLTNTVKSVNGTEPDENGNVEINTESVLDANGKLLDSVLPDGYPHDEPGEVEVLLPECTVTDGCWVDAPALEEGKAYTVVLDGVEYPNLVAELYIETDWDEETGEDVEIDSYLEIYTDEFLIEYHEYSGKWNIFLNNGQEATMTVFTGKPSTLVPMSKEYLPKVTAIADLTEAPTAADFNNLLAALRAAGYMAE